MKPKISKSEIKKEIDDFFFDTRNKTSNDVKKIKELAMSKNVPLKENRKKFCKFCLSPYRTPKTRIKNQIKSVICEKCGKVSRWKLK
jgi:RNase P subunit RPR2